MLERLQQKWKVSGSRLLLVLITFALGGSLCGYAGRKILNLFVVNERWIWIFLYIIFMAILWPLCVLLISIPLGQYTFFNNYVHKMGRKLLGSKKLISKQEDFVKDGNVNRIAIFASGAGSNAKKIIAHFKGSQTKVVLIVCNKQGAAVLDIAKENNISTLLIKKDSFFTEWSCIKELKAAGVDLLVGFLWKVPPSLIQAYPGRIINIHPALLPGFGGKGMYGAHVHEAVIAAGEKVSGISIHLVDEQYDHGKLVFQAVCPVDENESAASLAGKIHQLEHKHYPVVIDNFLRENKSIKK